MSELTVGLSLDKSKLKQGFDGAGADAENFKKKFESSMRETRGAVKDVAGSIDGIGRAFDGSIQGAIGGFKDLVNVIQVAPWAGIAAGVASIFTVVVKQIERTVEAIDKAGDSADKIRAKSRASVLKAFGAESATDKEKDFRQNVSDAAAAQIELGKTTEQVRALENQIAKLEPEMNVFDLMNLDESSISSQVLKLKKQLEEAYKAQSNAADRFNTANEAATNKELASEIKKVEQHNKGVKEYLKGEEEKKKAREKAVQIENDLTQKEMEARAKAQEDIADVYKRREGNADFSRGIDMYQRMGGRVGANLDVGRLSRQTEQEKIQAEIKEINKKMEAHLEKIRQNADIQMDEIKHQKDSEPF